MNLIDFTYWLINGRMRTPAERYLRAAERGNAKAQLKLGLCYYNGQGVEPNPAEAVRWFRLAAKQKNAEAEFYMGRAYNTGEGVKKDDEVAYAWFERAAQKGHRQAAEWRSILAQEMTPEQISEGLALSTEIA
ncbi:MAG: sel1 repeat family protein [Kiritimatiellales bacterium]|nr:sel1 repeat family protein [Kiritimatiellota bacterium]MBL7017246.1 sel1 repeat family protein [Kiritimatiellales bacterium]